MDIRKKIMMITIDVTAILKWTYLRKIIIVVPLRIFDNNGYQRTVTRKLKLKHFEISLYC